MDALERIKEQVQSNKVILYMKGTPQMPQCGFSSRTAEALKQCGKEFAYVNVLLRTGKREAASKILLDRRPAFYQTSDIMGLTD